MRRIVYLLAAMTLLVGVLAVTAYAGDEHPENVTLCHAAGLEGTTHYETLTVGYPAAFGPAGHFDENGTPNAGHEQDYLGECQPPPPVDVCPNLEGNQAEVPPGYHLAEDENGRPVCLPNPPEDQCPNIEGVQEEVPEGLVKNENGECVPPTEDVCPNLEGVQSEVPEGYVLEDGECVIPPPPDVCPNIEGVQSQVPAGMVVDANGNCVVPVPPDVTGSASVICLLPASVYQLSGTVDGQAADKVEPATLPGNTKGVTNVVVTRGDTSVRTAVATNGDCGTTTTVTTVTPTSTTTPPPVTVTPPPVSKPPVVKPKPKKRTTTVVKKKAPVKKAKPHKKPQKAPKTLGLS